MKKSGIIVLNKEIGMSSNTAVNRVKYIVGAKKAGHLGTLDVLGEGVLPVTLNKGTRLFDYFLKKDKTYKTVFVFGFETTTLDCEGEVSKIKYKEINIEKIEKKVKNFIGKIQQIPPQYSALKVRGKTAYERARAGEVVELKSREVEIYDFKLLRKIDNKKKDELIDRFFKFHDINFADKDILQALTNNVFEFEITCSSGTYIRSLCRDLAKELSTYGVMLSIIRTRCGGFLLKNAKTLEEIKNRNFDVIAVDEIITLSSVFITEKEEIDLLHGKPVTVLPVRTDSFKLYSNNTFIGIANNKKNGILKIESFLKDEMNE